MQLSKREFSADPKEISNLVDDMVSLMQEGPYAHLLKDEKMVPKSLRDISLFFKITPFLSILLVYLDSLFD